MYCIVMMKKVLLGYASWVWVISSVSSFAFHSQSWHYHHHKNVPVATTTTTATKTTINTKLSMVAGNMNAQQQQQSDVVDIDKNTPRDIATFEEWATACGVQKADGFQLVSSSNTDDDTTTTTTSAVGTIDVCAITTQDIPANNPVLYVPNEMILMSSRSQQELGPIPQIEERLKILKATNHIPQFYLFLKILIEYEKGTTSPWYYYLNSLPKTFSNGASMTTFCFDCLPPLVGYLSMMERIKFIQFFHSLKKVNYINDTIKNNKELAKWAFAVVYTRGFETEDGDFRIVPMGDMFNHGTQTEIQVNYDEQGNYYAYTTYDVPAGSPLRMSYGDYTNPSNLFARYGFLDESSPATFCKIMITRQSQQLIDMGYDHSKMLFYKDTGGVSEEVWDVLLYQILESDPQTQQALYQAHMSGDYDTKQAIHQQYYPQTLTALTNHVDSFLHQLDRLSAKGDGKDLNVHPRLPLILKHNEYVKQTFLAVRSQLPQL